MRMRMPFRGLSRFLDIPSEKALQIHMRYIFHLLFVEASQQLDVFGFGLLRVVLLKQKMFLVPFDTLWQDYQVEIVFDINLRRNILPSQMSQQPWEFFGGELGHARPALEWDIESERDQGVRFLYYEVLQLLIFLLLRLLHLRVVDACLDCLERVIY